MSNCSDSSSEDKQSLDDPNVFQVGFNISVSGTPGTGFQVVVNDQDQKLGQLTPSNNAQLQLLPPGGESSKAAEQSSKLHRYGGSSSKSDHTFQEPKAASRSQKKVAGGISKQSKRSTSDTKSSSGLISSSRTPRPHEMDVKKNKKDKSIIEEIKNAMGKFERFSEHCREVPRFMHRPVATSTPFMDRYESRSESNLSNYEDRYRRTTPGGDFRCRASSGHFRSPGRPADLFLKPLPAEDYFKRGVVSRCFDIEQYRQYGSVDSLTRNNDISRSHLYQSRSDTERYDGQSSGSEYYTMEHQPPGILKKTDAEIGDKQSSSSAESLKDIKIYQSGGILIMQNFNENLDMIEKKDISDISAKLIENCNKLKEEISSNLQSSDDCHKPLISNSSDEVKGSGKMVQFDLPASEFSGSRSADLLSDIPRVDYPSRAEQMEARMEHQRHRDQYPAHQAQDYPSLSTQENDSLASNMLGMSPTSSTSGKKLEWDSGADVGYLNLDLTQENLSTIERIILKGLSNDGRSEKKVVYEKRPEETHPSRSKFVLERLPSELVIEGIPEMKKQDDKPPKPSEKDVAEIKKPSIVQEVKRPEVNKQPEAVKAQKEETASAKEELKPKKLSQDENLPKTQGANKKTQTNKLAAPSKIDKQTHIDLEDKKKGVEKSVQTKQEEISIEKEIPVTVDKSTNVDTLFRNSEHVPTEDKKTDDSGHSESSDRRKELVRISPRVRKLKKKKFNTQSSNLTARLKDKIENIIDIARQSSRTEESSYKQSSDDVDMGIPKKVYRRFEGKYGSNEIELCRDFEEIIIDQRFKIKQNVAQNRDVDKSNPSSQVSEEVPNEKKTKNRPISASSSSNITVLPNENNEIKKIKNVIVECLPNKFIDQLVQTNEYKYESKGVQAFESRKSSVIVSRSESCEKIIVKKQVEVVKKDPEVRTCSKSIQASGMTSSLPKHLEHPKGTNIQGQNTKSTQFFGGPINSLPNYHSNLITKPGESCSRMPKVLKTKTNSVSENNQKNRNDSVVTDVLIIEEKKDNSNKSGCNKDESCEDDCKGAHKKINSKEKNDFENKENMKDGYGDSKSSSRKNSVSTKKSEKESDTTDSKSKKSTEKKKDAESTDGTQFHSSEDILSKKLTTEVLKRHGDSVDRSIIQEKYFQSQLMELERREMISRSTSMERHLEQSEQKTQTTLSIRNRATVGCQYSPQRRRKSSRDRKQKEKNAVEKVRLNGVADVQKWQKKEISTDQCDSSQNLIEDERFGTLESTNQEQAFGTVDSLASSTQTAHSWVPGMQDATQNVNNVVGRARSFEYLPGHIYESSGNLREELPSETDQNLISGSTSGSSESDVSKPSTSEGAKDSEGRNTLVLEDTDKMSSGSSPGRNLDYNLVCLEEVIERLHEKETLLNNMTQSLLVNVTKLDGSGDGSAPVGMADVSRGDSRPSRQKLTETATRTSDESYKSSSEAQQKKTRKVRDKEMSIACQTDWKSPVSDSEKFYHERKQLERRIDEEKEHQIKWIENEIQHLNLLRGLLEKQEDTKDNSQRKKKASSEISDEKLKPMTTVDLVAKTILAEVHDRPKQISQVYGVSLSVEKKPPSPEVMSKSGSSEAPESVHCGSVRQREPEAPTYQVVMEKKGPTEDIRITEGTKYGMSVSLIGPNQTKQVAMVPVGVQVTLKDKKARSEGSKEDSSTHGTRYNQRHPCVCCGSSSPPSVDFSCPGYPKPGFPPPFSHYGVILQCRCKRAKVPQFDMNTQYPSLSDRNGQTSHTTATQVTDSLRNCPKCRRSKCVCINLNKAKSRGPDINECTNKKIKVIDETEFGKSIDVDISATEPTNNEIRTGTFSGFHSTERRSGVTPRSSAKKDEVIHVESASSVSPEKICNCSESSFLCTCEKCKCKCHEKPLPRCKQCKLLQVCRECKCYDNIKSCSCKKTPKPCCNCKSNLCKKCNSEILSQNVCKICRCEANKEANCIFCTCHLAKSIHVPKCNCHEKYSSQFLIQRLCKCHNRNCKYFGGCKCNEEQLKKSRERIPPAPEQNCPCPCCEYYYRKVRANLYERQFGQTSSSPVEKRQKVTKEPPQRAQRAKRSSPNIQGHPRHYFLKIEETEEDSKDSTEVEESEKRKPVEIVTIKIPVKKRGRARSTKKNYENEDPQLYSRPKSWSDEYRRPHYQADGVPPHVCTCCLCKRPPTQGYQESDHQRQSQRPGSDYLNYDKKEFMTKSELERQKRDRNQKDLMPSLQECLVSNRPDFYNNAEYRRQIISEMAREREQNQNHRVKNLANILSTQNGRERQGEFEAGPKRIFTTSQLKEQTLKNYKRLPEVLNEKADRKKKEEYRTNRLMADIFAKKIQLNTLKGQVNMSNSVSVLSTI